VNQDADDDLAAIASAKLIQALHTEIAALRTEIQEFTRRDLDK